MTDLLVDKIEELPLSGDDLINMAKSMGFYNVRWILYKDLEKYDNVDQLFEDKYHAVYVLLLIRSDKIGEQSIGHWVCFIYHRERDEYFWYDSYAIPITKELSITQEKDTIVRLTKNINLGSENVHQHQLFRDDVNTCGRHCVLRSIFHHLDNEEYHHLVVNPLIPSRIKNADVLVALITGLVGKTDEPLKAFFNKKEKTQKKFNEK